MRLLILCLSLLWPLQAQAQDPAHLTVTGQGEATAMPDMATLRLGVTEQAGTSAQAMDLVSEGIARILDRLAQNGIAPADVQTSDLSLNPLWTRSNSDAAARINGFEASSQVTVRVRDLEALGDLLGAVLDDGANRFSGLQFGLQDPRPVQDAARRAAVADALARAALYADAAGMTLGPIRSITEGGAVRGPGPVPVMEMRAQAVPVAAGETSLRADVTIVFDLAP